MDSLVYNKNKRGKKKGTRSMIDDSYRKLNRKNSTLE